MRKIDLTWTWALKSPLHPGSGHELPGYADRLVQKDADGNPFIPGDAVKGALRLSAEEVARWLGVGNLYDTSGGGPGDKPPEPGWAPLAALFGGKAQAHFSPISIQKGATRRIASTALDADGRAKDETLRTIEVVDAGASLSGRVEVWVADELAKAVETLLVAALAATESLAGKAGIGWGRVDLCDVKLAGRSVVPDQVCSKERLEALKGEFGSFNGILGTPGTATAAHDAGFWYRLDITLGEPLSIADRPWVSNQVKTLETIPATTLRGALRAAWAREGKNAGEVAAWLGDWTRWTPALPAEGDKMLVPVPRSFSTAKGDRFGKDEPHGLHDALNSREKPPEVIESDGVTPIQWRTASGWMHQDASAPLKKIGRENRMHVARDYETRSKRTGALYSREGVVPGTRFVAWARLPEGVSQPKEVFFGKRTSAGNGRATIQWKRENPPTFASQGRTERGAQVDTNVFVQLLSPAIVRGPDGHPLRSLSAEGWCRLAGLNAGDILPVGPGGSAACTVSRRVSAWMQPWGHARAPITTMDAGSVWRLRCKDGATAARLRAYLTRCEEDGLGERTHEGFGRIAVDPPWLGRFIGHKATSKTASRKRPVARGEAEKWPGFEGLNPADLVAVANQVSQDLGRVKHPRDLRGPLQDLATWLREPAADDQAARATLRSFYCHLVRMTTTGQGHRSKLHQWEGLANGEPVRTLLEKWRNGSAGTGSQRLLSLRFAVEALLIHVSEVKEVVHE